MKHIPILFNIVVIVFLCMHASLVHATNAMNLSAGQVVCKSPQDRPYCVPEQEIFSDLVLSIAENGEVSKQRSISFEHAVLVTNLIQELHGLTFGGRMTQPSAP